MNYVQSAGLNVEKQGFFLEPKDEPLAVMILAVRSQDKDNETYKKLRISINPKQSSNSLMKHLKAPLHRPINIQNLHSV